MRARDGAAVVGWVLLGQGAALGLGMEGVLAGSLALGVDNIDLSGALGVVVLATTAAGGVLGGLLGFRSRARRGAAAAGGVLSPPET